VITADWYANTGNRWIAPAGIGVGHIFKIGPQPVNARVQLLNNVVRTTYAPTWQMQFQVQLLYPAQRSVIYNGSET
jgi:hypothetical protein